MRDKNAAAPHPDSRPLSDSDTALWHTLRINLELDREQTPGPVTHYGATYTGDPDERILARGPFQLLDFRSLGDGSYLHNNGFFFATGGAGAAATVAYGVGQAIGNSRRRNAAAAMAMPRWTLIDGGMVDVTDRRLVMQTPNGLYSWWYSAFTSAMLVGPRQLNFTGGAADGREISWILDSDWAELALTIWARLHAPAHPQRHSWLPPDWAKRVILAGQVFPPGYGGAAVSREQAPRIE